MKVISRLSLSLLLALSIAQASEGDPTLAEVQSFYNDGQYFTAARYAFTYGENHPERKAEAYAWITQSLASAGMYQSGSYFYIRTLQMGNVSATRRVSAFTQDYFDRVGPDLFRKYMIRHTKYEDYDAANRSAYLYSLGKEALLRNQPDKTVGYIAAMGQQSGLWPYALLLRATAYSLQGKLSEAIADFNQCEDLAETVGSGVDSNIEKNTSFYAHEKRDRRDLKNRCVAGQARALYEQQKFDDAERTYDRIPKMSLVWSDILFEQGWNAFSKKEYNRTLGKLVSYKSPSLSFVFNTEIDVLRAQSYLALCLFDDANTVINEFNTKYHGVGAEVKSFVESNSNNLRAFYEHGKKVQGASVHHPSLMYQVTNRFVRSPYFLGLIEAEGRTQSEREAVRRFSGKHSGNQAEATAGFPGFLNQVLFWREGSIRALGGAFIKNSLMDYHATLITDFEKMSFIKLEMLSQAKEKILTMRRAGAGDRSRGNVIPQRRDDQYYWSFNGEFWNDELGDYVFGLESQCEK